MQVLGSTILYSDENAVGLQQIKSLSVKLCITADVKMTIGEREFHFSLRQPGEIVVTEFTAYLVAEHGDQVALLHNELIADAVGDILAQVFRVERGADFARLASCRPRRRTNLLARILGVSIQEVMVLLEQARVRLGQSLESLNDDLWVDPPPPNAHRQGQLAGPLGLEQAKILESEQAKEDDSAEITRKDMSHKSLGTVKAEQENHEPKQQRRRIEFRVQPTSSSGASLIGSRQVADAERAQQLVVRFEESAGQNRYPLPVDHMQGRRAYGCDVLSFVSKEDREQFQRQPDTNLVERFIEVKGRSTPDGTIHLKGNELIQAEQYGDRYYLYRVYEAVPGNFELRILADPCATALEVSYEVDLRRDPATTFWAVTEVVEIVSDVDDD